jgi:transcription termination factor Rho
MSVLDRAALEDSPLADLHAIASELSIDGYRRLRKEQLIEAILDRQGRGSGLSEAPEAAQDEDEDEEQRAPRRRGRRGGRGRARAAEGDADQGSGRDDDGDGDGPVAAEPRRRARPARPARREEEEHEEREEREEARADDELVDGVVELLPNGSGFLRVSPPEPSDEDVYISAAQVKRCELVSGDQISGPRRAPRRSERFASLVRIDTINGRPAAEVAAGARFDDLPAAWASERFKLGSEDPTVKAIEWLTPFGKGSRVTIVGRARAGKTEALRRVAEALRGQDDVQLSVVLAGVRPEEISEWAGGPVEPVAAVTFAASAEVQAQAVERIIDQARRVAARGGDVVVLIDTLGDLTPHAQRRVLAAARNVVDGGSLTIVATAPEPVGGETTVIALDASLASTGRFPALDLVASGTLHPELLVGEAGAEAITRARGEAAEEG